MTLIRIVTVDFYMSAPILNIDVSYSEFRGFSVKQVPVIRIFGSSDTGEKTCLHIHGAFPYIYVPFDGSIKEDVLMYQLASSLDKAINTSFGQASSNTQHVYKVILVSGRPMYGYHKKEHQFLKIYFYNPLIVKRACMILQNGSVLGRIFQPHEAHLPFVLQFMIDYNLHGMSFISLTKVFYRQSSDNITNRIDSDQYLPPSVSKTSTCKVEIDTLTIYIENILEISSDLVLNPGITALWNDEIQRRKNKQQDSQLTSCLTQNRKCIKETESHTMHLKSLIEKLNSQQSNESLDLTLESNESVSIYPAEKSGNKHILNASVTLDHKVLHNQSLGLVNESHVSNSPNDTLFLDPDALKLLQVLKELDAQDEKVDEDSVLSQNVKLDVEEIDFDMSLPLENLEFSSWEIEDNSGNNKVLIPQLDGSGDCSGVLSRKRKYEIVNSQKILQQQETIKHFLSKQNLCMKSENKTKKIKFETCSLVKNEGNEFKNISDSIGHLLNIYHPLLKQLKKKKNPKNYIFEGKKKLSTFKNENKQKVTKNNKTRKSNPWSSLKEKNVIKVKVSIPKEYGKDKILTIPVTNEKLPKCVPKDMPLLDNNFDIKNKNKNAKQSNENDDYFLTLVTEIDKILAKIPNMCFKNNCYGSGYQNKTENLKDEDEIIKNDFQDSKIILKRLDSSKTKKKSYVVSPIASNSSVNLSNYEINNKKIEKCVDSNYQNSTKEYKNDCVANTKTFNCENNVTKNKNVEKVEIQEKHILKDVIKVEKNIDDISVYENKQLATEKLYNFPLKKLLKYYQHILNRLDIHESQQFLDYIQERIEKKLYKSVSSLKKSPHGKILDIPFFEIYKNGLYNVQEVKEEKEDFEKEETKTNFKIKSLDGCWDSSSDEENDSRNKKKKRILKHSIPKYSHLKVSINVPKLTKNKITLECGDKKTNINSKSLLRKDCKEQNNLEQTLVIEEHVECRYNLRNKNVKFSKNSSMKNAKKSVPLNSEFFSQILVDEKEISDRLKKIITDEDSLKSNETNKNDLSETLDILESSTLDLESTVLEKHFKNLPGSENIPNKSEIYDKEHGYVSVAGPSDLNDSCVSLTQKYLEEEELFSSPEISATAFSSSTSSKSLTPYQKSTPTFINFSEKLSLSKLDETLINEPKLTGEGYTIIMPKYNPPPLKLILFTMKEFNLPFVRNQEPFYSNVSDVTGTVDIGHNTLKIPSNKSVDLEEFDHESVSSGGLNAFRKTVEQSMLGETKGISNIKLSFCSYKDCIVTPVMLPPQRQEVEKWLRDRNIVPQNTIKKKEKIKILMNCSPSNENDSCSESLTLTPCTPIESRVKDFNESENKQDTPRNKNRSPVLDKKIKKLKNLKKKKLSEKFGQENQLKTSQSSDESSLRRSLLQNQFLSSANPCDSRQISNVTLDNTHGFRMSLENLQKAKAITEHQNLTLLLMELHTKTRGDNYPNPLHDPIRAIFYIVFNDIPDENNRILPGIIIVKRERNHNVKVNEIYEGNLRITFVDSEEELMDKFVETFQNSDPDILAGYEIEMQSWGYLLERGYNLNRNLKPLLSRSNVELKQSDEERGGELKLTGRIILDVWRLLRHEIALQSYTFENVLYHVMHKRVPKHSYKELSFWWEHHTGLFWQRTIDYYLCRVRGVLDILEQLDIIGRTSELARLFGIQFYEVLSRGSQFRVESMMLRLAKPQNFIPVSPSVQQRAKMNAPEYLPLIFEPKSRFYADPVIVFDFQSLYPSMIIAYNYCFSTCLGKVDRLGTNSPFEFGATQLKVPRKELQKLIEDDNIHISPCGAVFVKENVREGILPRMLREILDTRLMVKKSMKENAEDKTLHRVLHNRQLGLKLIANVTYGYTAANFSGRMPSVEVGDSVVSKGRETLLRAIKLIENTSEWGALVVYGDTDSIFVQIPGKSKEEAFRIGAEIADAVTNDNPSPVKLKLEKVFQPCILQTKKRYVGYMYESPNQLEPELLSKGIETIRRDGCPASAKILEKSLKILFDTKDVSLIRQYVLRQFTKIFSGRVSLQDLIFAKEYRGEAGYRPGACVPALELARKWRAVDPRKEPRRKERVPYVIVNGPPGLPLIKLVRSPLEVLDDPNLRINAVYYITHAIIPPLNRCLTLIGADVNNWYKEMPRKHMQYFSTFFSDKDSKKSTISQYFSSISCATCEAQAQNGLCNECFTRPSKTVVILQEKVRKWENNYYDTVKICQSCCKRAEQINCLSLDCPVLYRLKQNEKDLRQAPFIRQLLSKFDENF